MIFTLDKSERPFPKSVWSVIRLPIQEKTIISLNTWVLIVLKAKKWFLFMKVFEINVSPSNRLTFAVILPFLYLSVPSLRAPVHLETTKTPQTLNALQNHQELKVQPVC